MERPFRIPCPAKREYRNRGNLEVISVTIMPPGEGGQDFPQLHRYYMSSDCQLFGQYKEPLKNSLIIDQLLSEGNARGDDGKEFVWEKLLMVTFHNFSKDKIIEILSRNVEYNGSRYCFLGFSEVDLALRRCFLIAENDRQISERRAKLGNFSKDIPFAKRVAEVQVMFKPYNASKGNQFKSSDVGYLDIFAVMLLYNHGIDSGYLLDFQREHHNLLKTLETDLTNANYFLRMKGRRDLFIKLDDKIRTHATPEMISQIKMEEIANMRECRNDLEDVRILVSESRQVFGVADPYNKLHPEECFFAPDFHCMLSHEIERFKSAEQVLVIPQPCYSASDIQRLHLSHRVKTYKKFKDCIVLPSQTGKRFVSRKYCVCWDSRLVLPFTPSIFFWNFSEIPSQVWRILLSIFQHVNVQSFLWSSRPQDIDEASFQRELKNYFAEYERSDSTFELIFRAKSLFKKFALLEGSASCSVCRQLATYLSPSFDWDDKREEIVRYLEDLDKKYENLSSKREESKYFADEWSIQDLKGLCAAMSENLNNFLRDITGGQG